MDFKRYFDFLQNLRFMLTECFAYPQLLLLNCTIGLLKCQSVIICPEICYVEIESLKTGIVVEVKYAENDALEAGCSDALKQIEEKQYEKRLVEDGMCTIIKYGISCYKKHCMVMKGE